MLEPAVFIGTMPVLPWQKADQTPERVSREARALPAADTPELRLPDSHTISPHTDREQAMRVAAS